MLKKLITSGIFLTTVLVVISLLYMNAFATTVTVLDGQVSITDSANSNTLSSGTVTITAQGSLFSKKTNNITITNETADTATLKFDYAASKYNSFKIAGSAVAGSGTHSVLLDAGSSVTLELVSNSGFSDTMATLALSNFSLTAAATTSSVTISYDSTLGSVTADGTAVTSGAVLEGTLAEGITLEATSKSGATFLGWIGGSGERISTAASYKLKPAADMTVTAAFASANSDAWFEVDNAYLFNDLTAACAKGTKIVLAASGTLPGGNYTIPSSDTLLIPFDAAHTLYTSSPVAIAYSKYQTPTPFRTLTMASGSCLKVEGALSLSGQHAVAGGSSKRGTTPTGQVGFIHMEDQSSISVESGGKLYAWGYITGDGTIAAKNGSVVYEVFQIMEYRGGTQSSSMDNGVFPVSQYYVQNIEVAITFEYGASEKCVTTINIPLLGNTSSTPSFIGASGSMFTIGQGGSVTKRYDGKTDRLIIDVSGNLTISNIELKLGNIGSIDSADYTLPLNNNITVTLHSGTTTCSQNLAILPGAEIYIEKDATFKLSSGKKVYVYDSDSWQNDFCFIGNTVTAFIPLIYAPSREFERRGADGVAQATDLTDALICVNGTLDASAGYLYTTGGGANIYSTEQGTVSLVAGTETVTYQCMQYGDVTTVDKATSNQAISITPAKLKNEDGSYTETSSATTATTFNHDHYICECDLALGLDADENQINTETHGKWHNAEHSATTVVTDPTCVDEGYTTYTCNCETTCIGNKIAALGHAWGEWDHSNVISVQACTRDCGKTHEHLFVYQNNTGELQEGVVYAYLDYDYFWMDATCYFGSYVDFDKSKLSITVSNDSEVTFDVLNAQSGNTILIAVKVLSDDLTDESMTLTLTYDGVSSDAFEVGFLAYYDKIYNTSPTQDYLDAIKDYGDASNLYFNGTEEEKAAVTDPGKPGDIDAVLKGDFNKQSYVDGMSMATTGANMYFDDALRLGVRYELSGTLPDGWTIVQVGLLVGENWGGDTQLTTSAFGSAYLVYEYNDGGAAFSAYTGEVIFDLQTRQYLSEFSIRAFAVVRDAGGNTHCIYGHQYRYGLETYINRVYTGADNVFKNLLVKTWNYANEASEAYAAYPPKTSSEVVE